MGPESLLAFAAFVVTGLASGETPTKTDFMTIQTQTKIATKTSSDTGATHTVKVGADGHKFSPQETAADVGDVIEYRFYPEQHWVIRGDFDRPCIPYENFNKSHQGFSSGYQPVEHLSDDAPTYRVRVNDTKPIFFYCGAAGSCVDYHMVGVVNPSDIQDLERYVENTELVDFQLRPGEKWPSEGAWSTSSAAPGSTASTDPGESNPEGDGTHSTLSVGTIAGIVVGGCAILLLVAALFFFCGRRGLHVTGQNQQSKEHHSTINSTLVQSSHWNKCEPDSCPNIEDSRSGTGHHPHKQVHSLNTMSPPASAPYAYSPPETVSPYTPITYFDPRTQQYYAVPAPPETSSLPVELPSSGDPGNSPLPQYSALNRHFSWAPDETGYRPSK